MKRTRLPWRASVSVTPRLKAKRVVVVGGGNVAMGRGRKVRRLGAVREVGFTPTHGSKPRHRMIQPIGILDGAPGTLVEHRLNEAIQDGLLQLVEVRQPQPCPRNASFRCSGLLLCYPPPLDQSDDGPSRYECGRNTEAVRKRALAGIARLLILSVGGTDRLSMSAFWLRNAGGMGRLRIRMPVGTSNPIIKL